jgi:hypothetical protein
MCVSMPILWLPSLHRRDRLPPFRLKPRRGLRRQGEPRQDYSIPLTVELRQFPASRRPQMCFLRGSLFLDGCVLLSKALIFAFALDSNSCRETRDERCLFQQIFFFTPAARLQRFRLSNEHYSAASKSIIWRR